MTAGQMFVTVLVVAAALLFLAMLAARLLRTLAGQLKARRTERSELRAAVVEYGSLAGLTAADMESVDQCGRIAERVDALRHRIGALARICQDSKGRAVLQQLAIRVELTRFVLGVSALRAELRQVESSGIAATDSPDVGELEPRLCGIRDAIRSAQQELSGRRLDGLLHAVASPEEAREWKRSAREHLDEIGSLAAAVDRLTRERVLTTQRIRDASRGRAPVVATRTRPPQADRISFAPRLRIARPGTRFAALAAFERALAHEAHTLSRWPKLLWQQLHNRLQWESEPVPALLVPPRAARSAGGSHAWLRTRIPFRESGALIRTLAAHGASVNACAVAPDGTFLVSASSDKTLKVWDTATGVELATLTGHSSSVSVCGVSADGRHVVSGGADGTLRIWDVATGNERSTLTGHTRSVVGCVYHPDGRRIASTGEDWTLRFWDATTGDAKSTIQLPECPAGLVFTPDGALVISATGKTVKVWDIASGREHATLGSHQDSVTSCAVSPDGKTVASTGLDSVVRLWDLARGSEGHVLEGHAAGKEVWSCAFSPDGSFIVSAGADGKLIVWDTESGARRGTLHGHARSVTGCAVARDGSFLLSASSDHTLKLWSTNAIAESPVSAGHEGPVFGCAIGGGIAVTAGRDGTVMTWDLATARQRGGFTGHRLEVWACAVPPGGGVIVSGGQDETLRTWDQFGPPGTIECQSGAVRACAVSTDGALLVSGGADGSVKMWHRPSRGELMSRARFEPMRRHIPKSHIPKSHIPESDILLLESLVGHKSSVLCSAISRDGRFIISGSDDSTLKIWEVASRSLRATLQGHKGPVWCCAISRDGVFIVSGGDDGTLRIWDAATGRQRTSLTGHAGAVRGCAVAPDGTVVVSAGEDKLLKVWDVVAREIVVQIPLSGEILCAAWHPREPLIACGDRGGSFQLLDVVGLGPTAGSV